MPNAHPSESARPRPYSDMMARVRRAAAEIGYAVVPALVAAALHLGVVTVRREWFGGLHWDWNTRDVGWMVPAGYLLVFAACALPLAAIAAVRRAGLPARARVWFWSSLTAFSVLLLFTRVQSVAWIVVALGIGLQASGWAVRHPAVWGRTVRRTEAALGVGFVAYAATIVGGRAWRERSMLAALPAAAEGAPNVLLVIWDTARAQNLSLYGYGRPTTPFLDSLARHGVVFEHAFSTAPWTLPSHASMLTGQYAMAQSGSWQKPLDATHRTLPEVLSAQGYATGAFVANFTAANYATGLHRGFAHFEDHKRSLEEALLHTTLTQSQALLSAYERIAQQRWYGQALRELLRFDWRQLDTYQMHDKKDAVSVTDASLRWLASVRQPSFAMLNYMEAHGGYVAPSKAMFGGGAKRIDVYDGSIWWLDRELRRLVSELQRRGELERTIIIVTSDHGEQFGEHDLIAHGNSLYSAVLHVPLVIYAPGRLPGGVRVGRAVSLRDVARTIQDLAGVQSDMMPGASLAALATNPLAVTSPVIAHVGQSVRRPTQFRNHAGPMLAVLDDTLHVIRDGTGLIEAYAYRTDVEEKTDLARDPVRRELAERLLNGVLRGAGLVP